MKWKSIFTIFLTLNLILLLKFFLKEEGSHITSEDLQLTERKSFKKKSLSKKVKKSLSKKNMKPTAIKTQQRPSKLIPSKKKSTIEDDKNNLEEDPLKNILAKIKGYNKFMNSFRAQHHNDVIVIGKKLLKTSDQHQGNWWYGDYVHWVNITLAKSFLRHRDLKNAKKYLLNSVSTKYISKTTDDLYSPMLASFGPDRAVAYDLYHLGEKSIVINYFEETKNFWKSGVEHGTIDKIIHLVRNSPSEDHYYEKEKQDFPFRRTEFSYGSLN